MLLRQYILSFVLLIGLFCLVELWSEMGAYLGERGLLHYLIIWLLFFQPLVVWSILRSKELTKKDSKKSSKKD